MSFVTAKLEVGDVVTCGQGFLFFRRNAKVGGQAKGFQKRKGRRTACMAVSD